MGRLIDQLNTNGGRLSSQLREKEEPEQKFSFGKMMGSIIPSAVEVGKSIGTAFAHPVQTIKGLGQVGAGAIQSIPVVSDIFTKRAQQTGKTELLEQNRKVFQNVKNFFFDRYGSPEKALKSLEEDPVGVALDVSVLFSGAGAGIRAASMGRKLSTVSKAGKIMGRVGEITEPITATGKTLKTIGIVPKKVTTTLGKASLGVTTGAGGEALRTAYQGAKIGSGEFKQALRGKISQQDVLTVAKEGLNMIKQQRTNTYIRQLQKIKDITKTINLEPIKAKIKASLDNWNIKIGKEGKLNFSKSTIADTAEQKRISSIVNETLKWKDTTPAGLDVLKRRLDDFFTTSGQGRSLTNSIRSEVSNTLTKEVKGYSEMTKGYREASDLINEIERTLSLGKQKAVDSTLRKLTSSLKDNADFKRELLTKLDAATEADVAGQIAGAILNPVVPSGLIGRSIFAGGPAAIFLGSGTISPLMLQPLLMSSPRVIGEFLLALGTSAKYTDNILKFLKKMKVAQTGRAIERPLFQAGRLPLRPKEE